MSKQKIYYVEIKDSTKSWIAAVCKNREKASSFINKLPEAIKTSAQLLVFEAIGFPIYAIEYYLEGVNSFRFANQEELYELIRQQKEILKTDSNHLYFTFYMFETDYFQTPTEKSLMGALEHTHVDNTFLQEETLTKSQYYTDICSLADNYDIDGLDSLLKLINNSQDHAAKYDLAHYGYLSILWDMIFDFACNKLPESGIDLLIDLVENAELLLGKKNWQARAEVHYLLLENACNKHNKTIITFLRQLNDSLIQFSQEAPDSLEEINHKQSSAYAMVADALPAKHEVYWQKAIVTLQNGIEINPESADWTLYAKLVFFPAPIVNDTKILKEESHKLTNYQLLEQETFHNLLKKHEHYHVKMPYLFALQLHRLKEQMDWFKINEVFFPQTIYLYWLDKTIANHIPPINRIDLSEACHFFHSEGIRLSRIDLLEKAIELYHRIIGKTEEYSFEIHYLASAMEDISSILYQSDKIDEANSYMNKAYGVYEQYLDKVKANYSVHHHYAEFIERCFHSEENIRKPDFESLRQTAIALEMQGEGFYSSPLLLRMRLALHENKEEEAIIHITKSLILHELCIDKEIDSLIQAYQTSGYEKLIQFLLDTREFMKAVDKNYYYDPKIKWEALKNMPPQKTISYWEERKSEIKTRSQS